MTRKDKHQVRMKIGAARRDAAARLGVARNLSTIDYARLLAAKNGVEPPRSKRAAQLYLIAVASGLPPPKTKPKDRTAGAIEVEGVNVTSDAFLATRAWKTLRYKVIRLNGIQCQCCGATKETSGKPIHVDHIKPRRRYPELALDIKNLQILCADCNAGKGNWDETDWRLPQRTAEEQLDLDQLREFRERGLLN